MRKTLAILLCCTAVTACGKGAKQADALDRAAAQSDPAAAAELRNQAHAIRESGSEADMADPGSPAQAALQNAGNAAARDPASAARPGTRPTDPQTGLTR